MTRILHVKVAEPVAAGTARVQAVMEALQRGETPEPYFGVGFQTMAQMLAVFTPKRLELIARLRAAGPMPVAELSRLLGRHYKNVHGDVAALMEWSAVERDASGNVSVPWDEIDVRLSFGEGLAA